jgi:hypothetical protein
MAANIPWGILAGRRRKRVLDPMAGSGTTIVVARATGHEAIGFDADPLAVLLTRVWSCDCEPERIIGAAEEMVERAKKLASDKEAESWPAGANQETITFVRYWFDIRAARRLRALADAIATVGQRNVSRVLWCAFSRLIITKDVGASRARDVSHSRPHRAFKVAPLNPLTAYMGAVRAVVAALPFSKAAKLPLTRIRKGDARSLGVEDCSIDLVITSPPYLNAIDYIRGHKLALVWMGHSVADLRKLRTDSIGTEKGVDSNKFTNHITKTLRIGKLPMRFQRMLGRYILDMDSALAEITRVLRPRGEAVLVLGDCTIRGVFVPNSRIIALLAQRRGLKLRSRRRRPIPGRFRYLPPPGLSGDAQLGKRISSEVVLTFRKS